MGRRPPRRGATRPTRCASAVDEFDPAAIVLSFSDATGCDATALTDAVRAANGHSVLIVAQPGRSGIEAAADRAGADVDRSDARTSATN